MSDRWIIIPNWGKFQHYTDRTPTWIKTYTAELLNSDDYLKLPFATRGVLHGLWAHYALARGVVPASTRHLSRVLGRQVLAAQLETLNHAGFIDIVASRPLALTRSREKNLDIENKTGTAPAPAGPAAPINNNEPPTFPNYDEPPDPAVAALLRRVTDSIGKP